jgi:integrase
MGSRRPNGSGSGPLLRKDGRWVAALYTRSSLLTAPKRKFFYGRTQAEAQRKLDQAIARARTGGPAVDSQMLLGDWCEYWLAKVVPDLGLAESTVANYESLLKGSVLRGRMAAIPLARLEPAVIRDWHAALRGPGRYLSTTTVRRSHVVLARCLETAVQDGLLMSNPARRVTSPRARRAHVDVPTSAQVDRILRAMGESVEVDVLRFIAATGVRRGEAVALKWGDVSLDEGSVFIQRTESRGSGGLLFKEPKTHASRRHVELGPRTSKDLAQFHNRQTAKGHSCGPNDPVFADENEHHLQGRRVYGAFQKGCAAAGEPPFRVHALRHYAATGMLNSGISPHLVALVLGHSNPSITLDIYAHAVRGVGAAPLEALEREAHRARTRNAASEAASAAVDNGRSEGESRHFPNDPQASTAISRQPEGIHQHDAWF